jgi:lipoprotein-anchoring transpeptidase ErfK/SrfK
MKPTTEFLALGLALLAVSSCIEVRESPPEEAAEPATEQAGDASLIWRVQPQAAVASLDEARYDASWRAAPTVDSAYVAGLEGWASQRTDTSTGPADSAGPGLAAAPDTAFRISEEWQDIGADSAWLPRDGRAGEARRTAAAQPPPLSLPLGGKVAGPSVLQAQILLDLAYFSPGVLDGRWGANVERALFWFQRQEALRPTGQLDSTTLQRLWDVAGRPSTTVAQRTLTAEDVSGPFKQIPEDVYQKAKLDCLCYESLSEKLAELAHTTPEVLEQLNNGVDLNAVRAGDSIRVPLVGRFAAVERASGPPAAASRAATDSPADSLADSARLDSATRVPSDSIAPITRGSQVVRIIVSDRGRYLHALDTTGRILYHLPASIGSEYFPSPAGDYRVTSIHEKPGFHYQPALLEGEDPSKPTARLAPGPNNPVGEVWIALSKEHFGIHGTDEPESIGYMTSSGCVRLTNWDAMFLARSVAPGVVVEFRDLTDAGATN